MNEENNTIHEEKMETENLNETLETAAEEKAEVETPESEPVRDDAEVWKEQYLRTVAEFDNFKKRQQRENTQIIAFANERLMVEILPVIDDMERAIKAAQSLEIGDQKIQQHVQGFEFIYKKLMKALESKGLKAMESVGKPMDVHLHDALMQVEAPDKEPNTILDEHEKGYYLNDKVIRHAKVIVSK
ncbi:nucleotide exchange factor GrpE [bacterium]|nr:nucleotide exchange factor GrpE [bacterium]